MPFDLEKAAKILKPMYADWMRQHLEEHRDFMNRFDVFTWRGKLVWCPNCTDVNMFMQAHQQAIYCPQCGISVSEVEVANSGAKELTVEVLDHILQQRMWKNGELSEGTDSV